MKKIIFLLFISLFITQTKSNAQFTRYIVKLKDKGTNPYSIANPLQYLTQRSIDRRTRYSIAIDSTDLPITPRYIDSIRMAGAVTILNSSKWLNQVAILTSDAAALTKINNFPFVIATSPLGARTSGVNAPVNKKFDAETASSAKPDLPTNNLIDDYYSYGQSYGQVHLHNGEFLHNRGFRGQGMQMAVLDGGFYHYLSLPTFDSVRNNGQILGTWDFVTGNASVDEDHQHGMQCLSTIAANMPGVFMGTAPKTSFYLYRTEDVNTEYPIEEQNWVAGMERADSLGIDISSTSLGYFTFDNPIFNHVYATEFDGNTTIAARGADYAAKKGIICVIAAGNEGSGAWHYIITPADADSVMAVGAVSVAGNVAGFSSYGPSSDGQIKPSVAAVGVNAVIANTSNGQPTTGSGTSFACPNMAGLTTCLWQAFPEINNMGIINVLQQSATRANNPDDRVGYGIPNMKTAFVKLVKQLYTQQFSVANCAVNLQWNAKTDSAITINVERKLPGQTSYTSISTQTSTGAFQARNFTYSDDLRSFTTTGIWYRFKMNIAADTSFYLDSLFVNFTPRPNLGADKAVSVCSPSSVNLTTQFVTTGLTASWTLGGATVVNPAAVTASGAYQLIASNTSGCGDTAIVNVTINPKPNLGVDRSVAKCTDSTVNLTTLFTTTGLTATWTNGGNSVPNAAAVSAAGVYQLIVVNSFGCADTALVTVANDPQLCPVIVPVLIDQVYINYCGNLPNNSSCNPPVTDMLPVYVVRNSAAKIDIMVYSTEGKIVYRNSTQQTAISNTYNVPMKKLASGIYIVKVIVNDNEETTKKVLKANR